MLTASTRALDRPWTRAASIPGRFLATFRASSTKAGIRQRRAHASQPSRNRIPSTPRSAKTIRSLLLEQVRPVERLVGLRDPGELRVLSGGQILGVLPEGEPGALEVLREGRLSVPPGGVPDLAPDGVEGLGRPGHDVERIGAQDRLWCSPPDDPLDPLGRVGRHESPAVVVDDDHEVALTAPS